MDLSIMLSNIKLNIRVGIIIRYNESVFIELSKLGYNSVIPGGRIKLGEKSIDALIREIREEMGFIIKKDRLLFVKIMENFYTLDNIKVHELFFIYEYSISNKEYNILTKITNNKDNINSYFKFVDYKDLDTINLLPSEVINIIRKTV